ncbi:hypothetical protein GGI11_001969 [Coemansia sp. RSA 2049]|nr:hypothetical protein GGI11_001969 [Coemansia sp. RSA 2049]
MNARQQSFTSKNGRLTVGVDAQVPSSLLQLLYGEENDGTSRSANGSVAGSKSVGESGHSRDTTTTYAPSIDGKYLVIGYADRYMLLESPSATATAKEVNNSSHHYRLMSVGNEGAASGERVTSLYCMDIYTSAAAYGGGSIKQSNGNDHQSMCVIVGYSSGFMRIFSMYGHLVTAHQFHSQPLLRIRVRMPSQANSQQTAGEVRYLAGNSHNRHNHNSRSSNDGESGTSILQGAVREDAEEVCLTYADGVMVSIDGKSLYLALRVCLNEAADGTNSGSSGGGGADEPVFQYKKWEFELNTPMVADAVSYGPAAHRDPLALLAKGTVQTSSPILSDATARFLVAPQQGDAVFGVFMTNEDAATSFSAVDIAGRVAAKVTGAVLSLAKSYFWRASPLLMQSSASEPSSQSDTPPVSSLRGDSGTVVPCAFAVRDGVRKVLEISLAPAQYNLAALTDSLGRVLVFDLETCEIVHMLKGLRGSQCAWLETMRSSQDSAAASFSRRMFVVVYTARRGTVEVFELGAMERPIASVSVGAGWRLVQCPSQPFGGSLVVGSSWRARRVALPTLATCILVNNSSGQVARVTVNE